ACPVPPRADIRPSYLEQVSKTGPGGRSWSKGTGSDRPVPRLSKRVSRLKNEALDEMRNQRLFPDWLRDEIPIRELPRDRLDPRPPLDRQYGHCRFSGI